MKAKQYVSAHLVDQTWHPLYKWLRDGNLDQRLENADFIVELLYRKIVNHTIFLRLSFQIERPIRKTISDQT